MDLSLKQRIINSIRSRVDVFYMNGDEIRIRCPICGDSQKNLRNAHCYIKCSSDPTEPLLYICFKCNSKGIVNEDFLDRIGVPSSLSHQIQNQRYHKIQRIQKSSIEVLTGTPIMGSPQVRYIESRLGDGFTQEDYDRFKIIWDFQSILPYVDQRTKNTLPSNRDSITFVSDDQARLLTRYMGDDGGRWRTITLYKKPSRSYYTIKTQLDLFTDGMIIINIAEGIFDILSVYRNFPTPNSAYIAALGSDYVSALEYMIVKGIVGKNVDVRIYLDSDVDASILQKRLKPYRWMFHSIDLYRNLLSKDIGVPMHEIKLIQLHV